ncbi:hypothetical protein [Nocardia sp. NPDC058480]|uniref:hypothetical protein n=1 Tax=Nocardia sp. NPDC058480 TaxID=3346522 RepID=UPI003649AA4D
MRGARWRAPASRELDALAPDKMVTFIDDGTTEIDLAAMILPRPVDPTAWTHTTIGVVVTNARTEAIRSIGPR